MNRPLFIIAACTVLIAGPAAVYAQANPSAAQIIQNLKPTSPSTGVTRGIRPSAPTTGTAEPATPTAPPPVTTGALPQRPVPVARPPVQSPPSQNLTVTFATGSAELTPDATRTLDELGKALTSAELNSFRFRIEGHTDTVGTPEANKALSALRAKSVADYLNSKFGVAPARLETVGMGEANLLVATPPQTAERRNRRVQVVNIGT